MKKLRTRLVSAFLVIMTLLTLLPTSALAASSTGTGIKPTSNTNYWTTRLLHDGTPYSYMELTLWHNTAHAESFQFYLSDYPCPGYAE